MNFFYIDAVNEDEIDKFNEISTREEDAELNKQNDYLNHANLVRDHHRNIKDNFERLERVAAKGYLYKGYYIFVFVIY